MQRLIAVGVIIAGILGYGQPAQADETQTEVIRELQAHVTSLRGNLSIQGKIHKEAIRALEASSKEATQQTWEAYQESLATLERSFEAIRLERLALEQAFRKTLVLSFLSGVLFSALTCFLCRSKLVDCRKFRRWRISKGWGDKHGRAEEVVR